MAAAPKKSITMDNLVSKVVMGLPFLSDKEIEMAWNAGQEREYQNLEDEMQGLRWWYLSEMLLSALITRNELDPQVAVLVVSHFLKQLDENVAHLKVDIKQRLKDYNLALQQDIESGGGANHVRDLFFKLVGQDGPETETIYLQSIKTVATRLEMTMAKFQVAGW